MRARNRPVGIPNHILKHRNHGHTFIYNIFAGSCLYIQIGQICTFSQVIHLFDQECITAVGFSLFTTGIYGSISWIDVDRAYGGLVIFEDYALTDFGVAGPSGVLTELIPIIEDALDAAR